MKIECRRYPQATTRHRSITGYNCNYIYYMVVTVTYNYNWLYFDATRRFPDDS